MQNFTCKSTCRVLGVMLALPLAAAAGQQGNDATQKTSDKAQQASAQPGDKNVDWQKMDEKLISADEVLSGDVTNGLNPLGNVRDLILTSEGGTVEYILYEVPYLYTTFGADDGFVRFDNVAFERGVGLGLNVRFDDEATNGKEELRLTASEADHRLVSNLLNEPVVLADDRVREIEDLLIDRQSGEIAYYVVQMNEDSLFNEDPRTIPADQVSVSQDGSIQADISLDRLENLQAFAPDFLR